MIPCSTVILIIGSLKKYYWSVKTIDALDDVVCRPELINHIFITLFKSICLTAAGVLLLIARVFAHGTTPALIWCFWALPRLIILNRATCLPLIIIQHT